MKLLNFEVRMSKSLASNEEEEKYRCSGTKLGEKSGWHLTKEAIKQRIIALVAECFDTIILS